MSAPVHLRLDGDVLWALLDRPDTRNAINLSVIAGLETMLATAEEHQVKVVVIRGEGGTFCSGADLHELRGLADDPVALESFMLRFGAVLDELEQAQWATVTVIEGHAVAGGCELLLASDISIAAANARIGDGHVNYGLVPAAGGSVRLPRAVAPSLARYLLLTGDTLSGAESARNGLVTMAVEPEALDERVAHVVALVRSRGRATVKTVKTMLSQEPCTEKGLLLRHEVDLFLEHMGHAPDARRGLQAFHDRVTASFDGEEIAAPPGGSTA